MKCRYCDQDAVVTSITNEYYCLVHAQGRQLKSIIRSLNSEERAFILGIYRTSNKSMQTRKLLEIIEMLTGVVVASD
jgi:hypothetical protein